MCSVPRDIGVSNTHLVTAHGLLLLFQGLGGLVQLTGRIVQLHLCGWRVGGGWVGGGIVNVCSVPGDNGNPTPTP